jgi:hypothetical protein
MKGVDKIKPILAVNVVVMILFSMAVCFTTEITTSKVVEITTSKLVEITTSKVVEITTSNNQPAK